MRFIPVIVFISLALAFALGMVFKPKNDSLPSPLIGKALPTFTLPSLKNGKEITFAPAHDRVTIINVFASWCIPCRAEHPLLMELAKEKKRSAAPRG